MKTELSRLLIRSKNNASQYKGLLKKIKRRNPKLLDKLFHKNHEEVFEVIDCLDCANCCKTTSPIFYDRDIERLSAHLKIKPIDFQSKYLKTDNEGDQVLKTSPCAFLDKDNYCSVYNVRPKACREYPHTNRKRMYQIMDLTLKNSTICPAVAKMFEQIKEQTN